MRASSAARDHDEVAMVIGILSATSCCVLFSCVGKFQLFSSLPDQLNLFESYQETPKCFTFEQPRDTPMFFYYEVMDESREITFDLYYGQLVKTEMQIMHKTLVDVKGHIDYMADVDGIYSYCLSQSGQYQSIPARFSITLNYGFDQEHYDKLVKDNNYDEVNMQVHKLNDLLTMTLNEADFQKHKETEYHDSTEKMNNAALWWPVLQVRKSLCEYICFFCVVIFVYVCRLRF